MPSVLPPHHYRLISEQVIPFAMTADPTSSSSVSAPASTPKGSQPTSVELETAALIENRTPRDESLSTAAAISSTSILRTRVQRDVTVTSPMHCRRADNRVVWSEIDPDASAGP